MPERRLTQVTIVDKAIHELQPAEMTYSVERQAWFIGCPSEDCGVGNLAAHEVTEQDDVITVSPSILCGCGAHYFVEQNKIRWHDYMG